MAQTLQEFIEQELSFIKDKAAKAEHLAQAIDTGKIKKSDLPQAAQLAAESYQGAKQYGPAAEIYQALNQTEKATACLRLQAAELKSKHWGKEAAEIYLRLGDKVEAVRSFNRSYRIEDILSVLPGDRTENLVSIAEYSEEQSLQATAHARLGNHRRAAEIVLHWEKPDYNFAIDQFLRLPDLEAAADVEMLDYETDPILDSSVEHAYSAYQHYLQAKKFEKAIDARLKVSHIGRLVEQIFEIHSLSGKKEGITSKEAWKKTASTLKNAPERELLVEAATAYEKAEMPKEAAETLIKSHRWGHSHQIYELLIKSGMPSIAAAKHILQSNCFLYDSDKIDMYEKAEMWDSAIAGLERERRDCIPSTYDRRLAPLYEIVGRFEDAADLYETTGETKKAIECRKKEKKSNK